MKMFLRSLFTVVLFAWFPRAALFASQAEEGGTASGAQIVSGLAMPHWGEGECRENFEVRIWPKSTLIWLEEENLRSLIADPATPDGERQSLKRLLALQRAWRAS
jgi:hypothetical protein